MTRARSIREILSLGLLLAGTLLALNLAGCPKAQDPTTPTENQDDDGQTTPSTPDDDKIDRPITPPDLDDDSTSSTDDSTPPTSSGSTGGGQTNPDDSLVQLRIGEPGSDRTLRLGETIGVELRLIDPFRLTVATELIVARDDDADGQPDGDPVFGTKVSASAGDNVLSLGTSNLATLIRGGSSRFLVGVRHTSTFGDIRLSFASGSITLDNQAPTGQWLSPRDDLLLSRAGSVPLSVRTSDTSAVTVEIQLDRDQVPRNGNELSLVPATSVAAGTHTSDFAISLAALPTGTFHYFVTISDGVKPATTFYASTDDGDVAALQLTNRLVGEFDLNRLGDSDHGAILQGFNFNDLAGGSMTGVPDLDGDGDDEIAIVSRFGKPFGASTSDIGFGEAYLLLGDARQRIRGVQMLNAVGGGSIPGVVFPGIRAPTNTAYTEGLSDVTVVPDMDGDELPELVFSFPRVESVSLFEDDPRVQSGPAPDINGMGTLEFTAWDPVGEIWLPNLAQFTRGGVVIVSSHNEMLRDPDVLNRKGDRVMDLHEVGQLFTEMGWCPFANPYVRDAELSTLTTTCDGNPTEYHSWIVYWDLVFGSQGPGGFYNDWTDPPLNVLDGRPPLAPIRPITWPMDRINAERLNPADFDVCDDQCEITNAWFDWTRVYGGMFPGGQPSLNTSWVIPEISSDAQAWSVWSGFYGRDTTEVGPRDQTTGARVLGQKVDDRFGTAVGSDGTWLYISAPNRTALRDGDNVPSLPGDREGSGVVYQLRTDARPSGSAYTQTQLWIEPDMVYPFPDVELTDRTDYTMPVPHQYLIEEIGSLRGNDRDGIDVDGDDDDQERFPTYTWDSGSYCDISFTITGGNRADAAVENPPYRIYPVGTAGYYTDRVPQIVGPHVGAQVSFVRGLGDLNDDGIRDFAIGSPNVRQNFTDPDNPAGDTVGAIFIVYGRSTGLEGDMLLDRMALPPSDAERLHGVLLIGSSSGEKLARVFDDAGDVNGDGISDVIIGNESADVGGYADAGEAIVILGSATLESPAGGWTVADLVNDPRQLAIRFKGESAGDLAGANVTGAGDVDGDGFGDLLIAAPGAKSGRGVVYLVYGSAQLRGELDLTRVGTVDLPGITFVGRHADDALGGGELAFPNPQNPVYLNPGNPTPEPTTVYSRGMSALGDLDGDGRADYAISAMLADANHRTDAGEVYILYGRGD